jgi:two-component system, cell cycle sensor histidine kinase and response regulator CckA
MMMKPVLVVDDEPQIRSLVTALLSREGFQSIEAGDGDSAFSAAQGLHGEISLLLTDVNMPGSVMDGIRLASAVKSRFPEIPVLFISSCPLSRRDLESAVPGSVFLQKPFDLKVFAQTIQELVTRSGSRDRQHRATTAGVRCPY